MPPEFVRLEMMSVRECGLSETWVQDRLAEDPSLLGLGELVLKDKERLQPKAGRLDLLLQDPETRRRYEVEVQLGRTDESHIIRTIEYWDIERKRYPQYDHTAVIVAEEINSRFLNVISLFNGTIPLVAIQMSAVKMKDGVSLIFTTVLDEMPRGLVDEDEEVQEVTDRDYWEKRGAPATVRMADEVLQIVRETTESQYDLKYNKFYIGLALDGQPRNFLILRPQKTALKMVVRLERSQQFKDQLDEWGLDASEYDDRGRRYPIRLTQEDLKKRREALVEIVKRSHEEFGS